MATQAPKPPSFAEIDRQLCVPGTPFELETVQINGLTNTVWKHMPKVFRPYLLGSLAKFSDQVLINAPAAEPAPVTERVDWTFGQVRQLSLALAAWMAARGVKQGSLVGVVGYNTAEWIITWVAIHALGAVPVMVNAATQADSMAHCLKLTKPELVLCDATTAVALSSLAGQLKEGGVGPLYSWQDTTHLGKCSVERIDLAKLQVTAAQIKAVEEGKGITDLGPESDGVIFFTSGTTGYPKAVLSSQRAALHGVISSVYPLARLAMRQGAPASMVLDMVANPPQEDPNVILMAVPFFHVTGCLSILLKAIGDGNTMITMRRWDVPEACRLMVKYGVNVVSGVPVILLAVMQSGLLPKDFKLKFASYGGAPAPERMPGDIKKRWPEMISATAWGMTETNAVHSVFGGEDYVTYPKSAGAGLPVNELRIVDPETRRPLPTRSVGVIEARGMNIMKGYLNDSEATAKAINSEGWLDTGDVGWMDENELLYISDRAKDIIIRGGENISSEEVENAVFRDDRISECAAVPVPDDILGELVAIAVSLNPGAKATPEDVQATVHSRVRSPARPVFVYVSDEPLPRNANGKLIKTEIKKAVQALYAQKKRRESKL
ncbi:uncharacterized protein CcaverHIS019_0511480 [Cutaneotrichosporon cavernicola]|uniref:Acetyl-CoA synthetase-like protein n=1 Tax=Cutaneotrichosporon cavernicola TaxID=279322 RepID=A0AA48L7U1_9TREE|nr:uncharacterized protein CcaverHIS019_0511480 [Cutaneotrichosporon cavernicola]BEI93520.1 hypothetical protein CcaverHIS019_0511480 [Cutaneotrichosporon cavernicola]BEJ01300.1 hypothetical protein CcaverHIS631_0511570 [Cutaneotrichosporon cavernicola]BEJ09066.1 hypothetical protein CcaverHIS641_0511600 [Cutaneotrichosporon cavernicola]